MTNLVAGYGVRLNDAAKRMIRNYYGVYGNFDDAYVDFCADYQLEPVLSVSDEGKTYYYATPKSLMERFDKKRDVAYISVDWNIDEADSHLADAKDFLGMEDVASSIFIAKDSESVEAEEDEEEDEEEPVPGEGYPAFEWSEEDEALANDISGVKSNGFTLISGKSGKGKTIPFDPFSDEREEKAEKPEPTTSRTKVNIEDLKHVLDSLDQKAETKVEDASQVVMDGMLNLLRAVGDFAERLETELVSRKKD